MKDTSKCERCGKTIEITFTGIQFKYLCRECWNIAHICSICSHYIPRNKTNDLFLCPKCFKKVESEYKNLCTAKEELTYKIEELEELEEKLTYKIETGEELMLSKNGESILKNRYLKKDKDGKVCEKSIDLFSRVSTNIASAHPDIQIKQQVKYFQIMAGLDFLPNSPTLMNAGRELQQLSACFVLPIEDSIESIFKTIKDTAMIHKSGGGTGFSFNNIRPKNSIISTSHGKASGPISFMKVFNEATEAINQGGFRRGANMGMLSVTHPDILEFIDVKKDLTQLNNFNISIAVTNEFMEAVEKHETYYLIDPITKKSVGMEDARMVFNKIVENAWESGEPGIIFIDNIFNPTPELGEITATNPCGEQPLLPYEACNLGSINLSNFVKNNKVDYDRLEEVVYTSVEFLNDVIDVCKYPLKEIDDMVKGNRKIGLGVMGFADMLFKLKIPYNSEKALGVADKIMNFIDIQSKRASVDLGKKYGAFPNYDKSVYNTNNPINLYKLMRNATTTTIAPTGTISIIAGCSSGIEPVFALVYKRNVMDGDTLYEVNTVLEKVLIEKHIWSKELIEDIAETGSIQNIDIIPDDIKKVFVTSHDISPKEHILMQAAFQKYVDNAVSKTVNFPKTATKEDIEATYKLAYKEGCVGCTVYRDGSRANQVLSTKETSKAEVKEKLPFWHSDFRPNDITFPYINPVGKCIIVGVNDKKVKEEVKKEVRKGTPYFSKEEEEKLIKSIKKECRIQKDYIDTEEKEKALKVVKEWTTKKDDINKKVEKVKVKPTVKIKTRPQKLNGSTYKIMAGCGPLYITINEDEDNKPFELFAEIGKAGGCAASQTQAIGRLVSLALRSGVNAVDIIKQLIGISCHTHSGLGGNKINSCADGIAKAIRLHIDKKKYKGTGGIVNSSPTDGFPTLGCVLNSGDIKVNNSMGACPDCGAQIIYENGCDVCKFCGYSKCS